MTRKIWRNGCGWILTADWPKRCRHPKSARMDINHADWDLLYDCNICRACGEWLPLGPANDSSEAVQLEIRAAEIAAAYLDVGIRWHARDPYEWTGWIAYRNSPTDAYGLRGDEHGFPAGWLASAITMHSEEP